MLKKTLIVLFISLSVMSCGENTTQEKTKLSPEQEIAKKADQEKYNMLANKYYGKKIPYSEFDIIGQPETLTGTNNQYWVVYFPKGDFTLVSEKKTDIVKTVYTGRNPK